MNEKKLQNLIKGSAMQPIVYDGVEMPDIAEKIKLIADSIHSKTPNKNFRSKKMENNQNAATAKQRPWYMRIAAITTACVMLVVGLGIGGYFLFRGDKDNGNLTIAQYAKILEVTAAELKTQAQASSSAISSASVSSESVSSDSWETNENDWYKDPTWSPLPAAVYELKFCELVLRSDKITLPDKTQGPIRIAFNLDEYEGFIFASFGTTNMKGIIELNSNTNKEVDGAISYFEEDSWITVMNFKIVYDYETETLKEYYWTVIGIDYLNNAEEYYNSFHATQYKIGEGTKRLKERSATHDAWKTRDKAKALALISAEKITFNCSMTPELKQALEYALTFEDDID